MSRHLFSTYLTPMQRQKLVIISGIEEVSGSCWLGNRIDAAWIELYGSAHPAMIAGVVASAKRTVTRADGKKTRI